jgi:hypothetical protein
MKVTCARFVIADGPNEFLVRFFPSTAEVMHTATGEKFEIENSKREWKPCATHALELVRMFLHQRATSEQAAKRVKKTKPRLKVAK